MNIGEKIKKLRSQLNLTQEQLALKSGISKNAIWNYENNKREPSIDILKKISMALEVNISYFIELETLKWINTNEQFYRKFINEKFLLNAIEYVGKDFNDFSTEKFMSLSEAEKEECFKDLSSVNPLELIRLYFYNRIENSPQFLFDKYCKFVTDYYAMIIDNILLTQYQPLNDKYYKLMDIVKVQNEVINNIKGQAEQIKNIDLMLDELNLNENIIKDFPN